MKYMMLLANCLISPTGDSAELYDWLHAAFATIRIATPIIVIALIVVDLIRAVAAGKDEDIKKAQANAIKRLIIGVVIFFVPTIVNIFLNLAGGTFNECGIGW